MSLHIAAAPPVCPLLTQTAWLGGSRMPTEFKANVLWGAISLTARRILVAITTANR